MGNLKEKLKKNKLTIGSWITLGHPAIAEIMAKAGFDWLAVDMEHSAITLHQAQQLIQVIELCGVTPLARVEENNPNIIKRVMDAGAHGVIVPMVNTKKEAEKAVNAVKYPPVGTRGVGLGRAQGYGMEFERYKKWVNKGSIVIVQIEHIDAIGNLNEILDVDGVDASIIGPYDLSASLGLPGDFESSKFKKALSQYESISLRMRKPMGFHVIHPDAKQALEMQHKGYTFLPVGVDTLYIGEKCLDVVKCIKGH